MEKISISEMAKLHGISRQTLIYYDSNFAGKNPLHPLKVQAL